MIVVRAFPEHPPPGRPHVIDGWPRVPVDNYDYRPLLELGDDVIVMDWDTAASREQVLAMAASAAADPAVVLVAPQLCYERGHPEKWNVGNYRTGTGGSVCCWHSPATPDVTAEASAFGFGMTYLPRAELAAFVAVAPGALLKDTAFTHWRYHAGRPAARVDWSLRPVHLHYPEAEDGVLPA